MEIFPGLTTLGLLEQMKDLQCEPEQFNDRGELKSKGHGEKSFHFNGSDENIELLLRTVISANQLRVYGAIADLCSEETQTNAQ